MVFEWTSPFFFRVAVHRRGVESAKRACSSLGRLRRSLAHQTPPQLAESSRTHMPRAKSLANCFLCLGEEEFKHLRFFRRHRDPARRHGTPHSKSPRRPSTEVRARTCCTHLRDAAVHHARTSI